MFKYLILCLSLVLALPSYAAGDDVFDGGTTRVQCTTLPRYFIPDPLTGGKQKTGEMTLIINNVQFSASADDGDLTGLVATSGDRLDCGKIAGFSRGLSGNSNLFRNLTQVGTLKIESTPWYAGEYFGIGNGLAMKVVGGDNQGIQRSPNETTKQIETYRAFNERGVTQIGLALQATLKVVGKVEERTFTVPIGMFDYTLYDNDTPPRIQTAQVPVSVTVQVTQAKLRSCTLLNQEVEFPLPAVQRADVFVRGTEVYGGDITIGPIVCDKGVDVKVSFFDHHNTQGLTDHLRTVYSDTLEPSQYAFKFYPSTGGSQPLQFLPLSNFSQGRNPEVNATTIDFAKSTVDKSTFQKNYRVNYVRLGSVGDDRPGKIKGIMTVEFLYY